MITPTHQVAKSYSPEPVTVSLISTEKHVVRLLIRYIKEVSFFPSCNVKMEFCTSNKPISSLVHFWLIYQGLQMFLKQYLFLICFPVITKKHSKQKQPSFTTVPRGRDSRLFLFFYLAFSNRVIKRIMKQLRVYTLKNTK